MTTAVLSFRTAGEVRVDCSEAAIHESRPLEAIPPFLAWAREYQQALHHPAEEERLLDLGCAIGSWLDGSQGWLTRLVAAASPPLILEIEVSRRPSPIEKAALDAPWELIAQAQPLAGSAVREHLALDPLVKLSPLRRLDVPGRPAQPSPCRLSVLFMAAQPQDVTALDFEREEAAIAAEISKLGADRLDLFVEESGTLDGLVAAALRAAECEVADTGPIRSTGASRSPLAGPVDVIHISCHGSGGDEPVLLLEDEVGDRALTGARQMAEALAAHVPALGFISACSTAEASSSGRSLAAELCLFGWPAVLGWSSPVADGDATWLAAQLYHRLAQRAPLADALAGCRYHAAGSGPPRRVWHQARLYAGRAGGTPIGSGIAMRRRAKAGERQYLDRAEGRVPVARDDEFVGRRRSLQRVLARLRDPTRVGAVLHGAGRLGKSSLAARVSHRRRDLHTVVIYKDYDAEAILGAIATHARAIAPPGGAYPYADEILARHRPQGAWDAASFGRALRELLEGPCRDANAGAILLVIDDFEQVLAVPPPGATHALVRGDQLGATMGALIEAFVGATTASRLLFTTRYRFVLPDAHDRDLARYLWPEPLGAMPTQDLAKRVRASAQGDADEARAAAERAAYRSTALELCHGSPGLLQVLLTIIERAPASWPTIEAELHAYAERGSEVTQADLTAFMTQVALGTLIAVLAGPERELLRLLTVFETHVPPTVTAGLGCLAGIPEDRDSATAIERMITLGLVDVALPPGSRVDTDVRRGADEREIAVNPLAALAAVAATQAVAQDTTTRVATASLPPLRRAWDAAVRARDLRVCRELTRLARQIDDTAVLAEVAGPVGVSLARSDARAATALAIAIADHDTLWPDADELRWMADACQTTGDPETAGRLLLRGLDLPNHAPDARARLQGHLADWHQQRGELAAAEALLSAANQTFEQLRDQRSRAVTLGKVADILYRRGQLDEALRIRTEEQLPIFERLGDVRARAVTLGKVTDILVARGQFDEAIRILRDDVLPAFERLGDVRSRAVTLGKVADILYRRGQLDEALRIRTEEQLPVYERLGDVHARAVTLGKVADILYHRGQLDDALRILREDLLAAFGRLGAVHERAVTLGKIADILFARGQLDEALRIRTEEQLPVFERLGDVRSCAVTLGQVADILFARGQLDEALRIRTEEQLPVYERLGDVRSRAVTLGQIADILFARGQLDEALRIRTEEELPVYERLGDVRARAAITLGQIADILFARGQLDEALRIRAEEELPAYERLGDMRNLCVGLVNYAQMLLAQPTAARLEEARGCLQRSIAIAEELGLPFPEQLRALLASLEQAPAP